MEPVHIAVAFSLGLLATLFRLPAMVGFLGAGFLLNYLGYGEASVGLGHLADIGVTLLLFTIGLKLKLNTLLKAEVWQVATGHLGISVIFTALLLGVIKWLGLSLFEALNIWNILLIAFALSFSSTVFAVKVLDEKGEMNALYGRIAIGILVMQDLFAVIFLTCSKGEWPSIWALGLLGLPLLRPVLFKFLEGVGHGELLILFGLGTAFIVGPGLFALVGLKADLGALIIGMMLAGHPKTDELAKALLSFKELLLIAFFLEIGLTALPDWSSLAVAMLLLLLLPLKSALFFYLFTRFKLRARTATHGSLCLANYSEFGLIVMALAVQSEWLPSQWLVVIALTVSLSFVVSAPLNTWATQLYQRWHLWLNRFQQADLLWEDRYIEPGQSRFLIFGMGRVGAGVYDELSKRYGAADILGVDNQVSRVTSLSAEGKQVIAGDATDADFWTRLNRSCQFEVVFLAMPHHHGNVFAARQLQTLQYQGKIAAIVQHADEVEPLQALGVHAVFNIYHEAGVGFAEHTCQQLRV